MNSTTLKLALVLSIALGGSGFLTGAKPPPSKQVTSAPRSKAVAARFSTGPKQAQANVQRRNSVSTFLKKPTPAAALRARQAAQNRTRWRQIDQRAAALKPSPSNLNDRRAAYLASKRTQQQTKPLPARGDPNRKNAVKELALRNIWGNNSISIIGHFPNYKLEGQDDGHNYFSIDEWDQLSETEQQEANDLFIDTRAAMRDSFVTSTPRDQIRAPSAFEREVKRLTDKGYTWNAEGNRLDPPPLRRNTIQ